MRCSVRKSVCDVSDDLDETANFCRFEDAGWHGKFDEISLSEGSEWSESIKSFSSAAKRDKIEQRNNLATFGLQLS
jgi:hypothetical protein